MSAAISLDAVRKDFGDFTALAAVSFEIADNEFFTLLGPSGCGKTTLLRMIAGFETASAGTIRLHGEEIEGLPPDRRPVNTVFQHYALFPHMSVRENVGFGLEMLGWSRDERERRVDEMIERVQLGPFAERRPAQLSGGQQQRVALARAMAPRPKVLLLDEPLSALDLKLRQQMRTELKRLQQQSGITFIFVTHDQEEALSMSDRIAVMSAGRVQQIGTPDEIYERPENRFVADFIGDTNLLDATIESIDGEVLRCRLDDGEVLYAHTHHAVRPGQRGTVSLRPEHLAVRPLRQGPDGQGCDEQRESEQGGSGRNDPDDDDEGRSLRGRLGAATYLGTDTRHDIELGGEPRLSARVPSGDPLARELTAGMPVEVRIADGVARFLID